MRKPALHLHEKFNPLSPAAGHPLGDFPLFKWNQTAKSLPDNPAGWTAPGIDCNAGYYSFLALKVVNRYAPGSHRLGLSGRDG